MKKRIKNVIEDSERESSKELNRSIELARECGVKESEILHNIDEVDDYFKS